ncbi:hypothetical protein SAMD00019534_122040 [Acytostelium subglobosum LB1]|uniref:hypothetical protein n=1 Tax=Acytostelium subglobosum LB1 TaxID=1410327 RepID=UPI0006450231|nr:hypothetical protein SAMD00019534_122040 [Acytostelium subglobosum LB1]GAM29028.1 hypothetical protein SAMD00019534_122040 [Acytostelium subglobosum LB1]|eukprot:XP_012748034.1 hypothetical protein SAMD00019534_122040 [Acytostelium subglobosum LB1]
MSSEDDSTPMFLTSSVDMSEEENEMLYDLLKKGCSGSIEGEEQDHLKSLLLEQTIEDRHRAQYRARHSIYPTQEEKMASTMVQFSKYHIDFGLKEAEKCKVGPTLKDKIRVSNRGSSKVSFNFVNYPPTSSSIRLTITPSSGVIKKNSSLDIFVELVVLCTTKVRELITVDISNGCGSHIFTIKLDSKMSQVLDHNEIEMGPVIGGGGYGAIYKSRWRGLFVAVKVISEMSDGSEFEKELEMHKELLHHPNVVHFVGFCVSPKCLVLEYVEGGSLERYLQDSQTYQFSPELRLKMAHDIAKGMCFLHQNEILHLDLKPQNFLVVSLSLQAPVNIKLADFGLATSSTRSFYGATVEGSFLYMSPEVFTQKKFSRAADVWSYGACLIEILSGKRPYQEYDELGYLELARVREEGLPPTIPSEIEPELKKLIEACIHRDHTRRPSFENIVQFLEKKVEVAAAQSGSPDNHFFQVGSPLTSSGSFLGGMVGSPKHSFLNPSKSSMSLVSTRPSTPKPTVPPRSAFSKSQEQVDTKTMRAMTELSLVSDNTNQQREAPIAPLPQRSVTLSTPSTSSYIQQQNIQPPQQQQQQASQKSNQTTTAIPIASRPLPVVPKRMATPPTSPNKPSTTESNINHIITNLNNNNNNLNNNTISTKTPPIPISKNKLMNSSSSTTSIPTPHSHAPPFRSTSAFEFKATVSKEESSSNSPTHTSTIQGNGGNSDMKLVELRTRSIRALRDIYVSSQDTIKMFAEIKSMSECIELGHRIRDFKKHIEALCLEHLGVSWDEISDSRKAYNKKTHISNIQSPHPSHFDGPTFNKVLILRDAAIAVGECALDSVYYLMTLLSPSTFGSASPLSSSPSSGSFLGGDQSSANRAAFSIDKDVLLKIAKITRDLHPL